MADWVINTEERNPAAPKTSLTLKVPPAVDGTLPREADVLYGRVRGAEGTARGSGFVYYGGDAFTPGKEHPGDAAKRNGPKGETHAAGPGQWQPGTWNGLKPDFEKRFGRAPDFSSDDDHKRMTWLNAAKIYPGGEDKMRADIAAGKLDTSALAPQWSGFGGGGWAVTQAGKWKVSPNAIAFEQGRNNSSVVWMSPDDYLGMVPESADKNKRRSLLKSLSLGDDIEAIPTLDAKEDGGRLKIFDQDGRNRARVAKEEGVGLIPVAVHGVGKDTPSWIEDMHGNVRPFNFSPVPRTNEAPSLTGGAGNVPLQHIAAAQQREIGFPYDKPGTTYGTLLPIAKDDKTGDISLAAPGFIRSAVRGAIGAGERAMGTGEAGQDPLRPLGPDETTAALTAVGTPLLGSRMPSPFAARPPLPTGAAASMNNQVSNFLSEVRRTGSVENAARDIINTRAGQDLSAGGALPSEIARQLAAGRSEGMVLADVAGENVRALLGNAAREPGPGRNVVKQWAVNRLGDVDRDSPIATNIARGIEEHLATGSARTEARALAEQRAASKPLWDEAMEGGNLPPIGRRLATDYGAAQRSAAQAKTALEKSQQKTSEMERAARDQSVSVPRAPTRLTTFLIRGGGLKDQGGELSYILGKANARPGLVNAVGKSLDDAALEAWEAGYLSGSIRPTTNDLLDAIAQDHNLSPVYSELDEAAAAEHAAAMKQNSEASQRGQQRPPPKGKRVSARDLQFQRDKEADLQAVFRRAEEEKADLVAVIRAGQEDGTAGLPGAVYSPYLARLLKNPRVKQGLGRGYRIERDIADGEGRAFRPRDYAILEEDANGDPVVGAIPNMKLLAVAKEGLDATLESPAMRDELTGRLNKEGRAVKLLRDGMVNELDRLNPAYKTARDQWAGDSALIAAVRDGKNFHKQSPEEIREWFHSASESEKEFYRLGASDTLRDDLERAVFAGDPSKAIINKSRARNQLLPMFRSGEDATKFLDKVKRARAMFQTPVEVLRGSQTAARVAEDLRGRGLDDVADVVHGAMSGAMGHHGSMAYRVGRIAARHLSPFGKSPEEEAAVNAAVARLLTDTNLHLAPADASGDLLKRLPLPNVQNSLARGLRGFGAKFASPSLP